MNNNNSALTLQEVEDLIKKFNDLYDENLKPRNKTIFSKEIDSFNKTINSERIGVPKGASPKEIGILLEKLKEDLSKGTVEKEALEIKEAERPEGQTKTTLTSTESQDLIEKYEKGKATREKTIEKAKDSVKDSQDR